jgi:hypothetical protein
LVRELDELVPSGVSPDVQFNLQLAIKAILTEPKPLSNEEQPKPEEGDGYEVSR